MSTLDDVSRNARDLLTATRQPDWPDDAALDRVLKQLARELVLAQASDWAFLDRRKQAGDYPYQRAFGHGGRLLEAIHSAAAPDSGLRNLAPDLSLAELYPP